MPFVIIQDILEKVDRFFLVVFRLALAFDDDKSFCFSSFVKAMEKAKLKVFINGTQDDMKPERDAVDGAVNSTTLATGIRAETAVS